MKREMRDLLGQARAAGAIVYIDGGGHYALRFPGGQRVVMSKSPSDRNAIRNAQRDVRNAIGGVA